MKRSEVWVLVLEPLEADTPDLGRAVARVLKDLLRRHGLRCIAYGGRELLAKPVEEEEVIEQGVGVSP